MTKSDLREAVREYLRQVNDDQLFSDTAVDTAIERAADDLTRRCDWAVVIDYVSGVTGQREIPIPLDIVKILSCSYRDSPGTQLAQVVTASDPANNGALVVLSTTGFDTSGTLLVEAEEITYTGVTATTFTGVTRGANESAAAAHQEGEGVVRADQPKKALKRTTLAELDSLSATWRSGPNGTPTRYYTTPAKLGFDIAPDKDGYLNFELDTSIRPELFASETSDPDFLRTPDHDLLALFAAHSLATRLVQDEASTKQMAKWLGDYLAGVEHLKRRQSGFESPERGRVTPQSGRI